MNRIHRIARFSPGVAVVAALSFALAVLVALQSDLGFRPTQHPLGLLASLPGTEGLFYRVLLYLIPGSAALLGVIGVWERLSPWRSGRLAAMLFGLAAIGFLGMGVFTLQLDDLDGNGSGLHAASWLLWLSAWLAGLVLLSVTGFRARLPVAGGISALLALGTALLAAGGDGVFTGPAAQLICWTGWLLGQLCLAGGWPVQPSRR